MGRINKFLTEVKDANEGEEWQYDPVLVHLAEQLRATSHLAIDPNFELQLREELLRIVETYKAPSDGTSRVE